jgi:hypothetical protein
MFSFLCNAPSQEPSPVLQQALGRDARLLHAALTVSRVDRA